LLVNGLSFLAKKIVDDRQLPYPGMQDFNLFFARFCPADFLTVI